MSSNHTLRLEGDCTIAHARALHRDLCDALDGGVALAVDCGNVERADVTLLQLLLCGQASFSRSGLDFRILDQAGAISLVATRAGFRLDADAGHIVENRAPGSTILEIDHAS